MTRSTSVVETGLRRCVYVGKESSQVYDAAFVILVSSPPFSHPSGLNSQHLAHFWQDKEKGL